MVKQGHTVMSFSATGEEEVDPDKAIIKLCIVSKSQRNDKLAMADHTKRKNALSQTITQNLPTDNATGKDRKSVV